MKQNYLKGKLWSNSAPTNRPLGNYLLGFLICLLSFIPAYSQTVTGGSLLVEVESKSVPSNWKRGTSGSITYHEATADNFQNPESGGKHSYSITFNQTGVYRVNWLSKINIGNSDSESNDNWLKFPNTDGIVFFGAKGNTSTESALISSQNSNTNVVYPKGSSRITGGTTPEGAGKDGWFKVFMNTKSAWVWEAKTSDNDGHQLYVRILNTGTYTMQISNRSNGHAIDKVGIWKVDTHGDDGGDITGGTGGGGDGGGGDDGGSGGSGGTGDVTFVLVNTNTQTDIMTLTDNSVIDLESTGTNIGIRADIDGTISSGPTFTLTGAFTHTQSEGKTAPYSLFGDIGTDVNPWPAGDLNLGDYNLSVNVGGTTTAISFEIVDDGSGGSGGDDGGSGGGGSSGDVTFVLVNTNTQTDIMTLTDNSVIDLESTGTNIGIRADIGGTVSSGPTFTLTGAYTHTQSEGKTAPYSLFGDIGTSINPWPAENLNIGNYDLSVKVGGTTTSISFEIVNDGSGGSGGDDGGSGGGGSSGDVTFVLVNTNTQTDIMTLTDNSVIDLESTGTTIILLALSPADQHLP